MFAKLYQVNTLLIMIFGGGRKQRHVSVSEFVWVVIKITLAQSIVLPSAESVGE